MKRWLGRLLVVLVLLCWVIFAARPLVISIKEYRVASNEYKELLVECIKVEKEYLQMLREDNEKLLEEKKKLEKVLAVTPDSTNTY